MVRYTTTPRSSSKISCNDAQSAACLFASASFPFPPMVAIPPSWVLSLIHYSTNPNQSIIQPRILPSLARRQKHPNTLFKPHRIARLPTNHRTLTIPYSVLTITSATFAVCCTLASHRSVTTSGKLYLHAKPSSVHHPSFFFLCLTSLCFLSLLLSFVSHHVCKYIDSIPSR